MSSHSGPEISNNGLVFLYDMANTQKSWRGAPTTNLHPIGGYLTWPTQTLHFWNGNSWVVNGTYTDPGVPGPAGTYLGEVRKYTSGALSATWSGNSYAYVLKTAAMTLGQSYAMSAYTYLSTDCNIDGMNSSIEGASVSALSGGYPTTYNMSQKGSWQRQGLQGSGSGNVNFIVAYPYKNGVTNGVFTGSILVGGAMVEFGTFPTPYTDTSRSNTQALIDAIGNNTLTATSLTYANNNTFSFDGSYSYLQSASNCGITGDVTLSAWIRPNRTGQTGPHSTVICTDVNYPYGAKLMNYKNNSRYGIWLGWAGGGNINYEAFVGVNINDNTDKMLTASWTQSTGIAKIYLNGVLQSTQNTGITSAVALADGKITIGTDYNSIGSGTLNKYLGNIYQASIYNRTLTDAEVQQNFNATRSRYGV